MNLFHNIFNRTAVAVTAICCALLCSCEKEQPAQIEVSAKSELLSATMNLSTFISVKCEGSWTLSLEYDDQSDDWAKLDVTSGTGSKNGIMLTLSQNSSEARRSVAVVLSGAGQTDRCVVTQKAAGEESDDSGQQGGSGENSGSAGVEGSSPLAKTGWMELPAMDNPDLGYYSHSFKMNGNTYRNYTFGWSQKDRVALWVAYPLCKLYTNGNVGRTEAWALDPLLGEDSAAPFGGYAGSYARGHQVASADRQCCYEANAQTYYGTNMTPQLNAHNEKIWSDLEGKVRGYANTSDTTYVVTGVMVSATSKKEKDSYGQSVTIPDAYFKAVLKYSKSSTMGTWNAAAFYLEHRAYTGSISKEHSMSIDELEKITGFDFFVNLPAKIGADQAAKIEAADPANSSVWW